LNYFGDNSSQFLSSLFKKCVFIFFNTTTFYAFAFSLISKILSSIVFPYNKMAKSSSLLARSKIAFVLSYLAIHFYLAFATLANSLSK